MFLKLNLVLNESKHANNPHASSTWVKSKTGKMTRVESLDCLLCWEHLVWREREKEREREFVWLSQDIVNEDHFNCICLGIRLLEAVRRTACLSNLTGTTTPIALLKKKADEGYRYRAASLLQLNSWERLERSLRGFKVWWYCHKYSSPMSDHFN